MSGRRNRRPPLLMVVAVVAVVFSAVGFAGGLWSSSSAEPTVQTFLLDWAQGDYAAAAAQTTGNPATVANALRTAYRQLHAAAFYLSMGSIRQHGGTAEAWFHASVDLGQDGAPWDYQGHFRLRQTHGTWKILWSPAVINPGLRPGLRLAVVTKMPRRAQLLDAAGKPLQPLSTVYDVGIRAGQLANPEATASALARATNLDSAALLGQIVAAPPARFWRLLTLSPADYARLHPKLAAVPGLVFRKQSLRLFNSVASDVVGTVETEVSPVLRKEGVSYHPGSTVGLTGLQRVYQTHLAGTPTTEVVAESRDGSRVKLLKRWPGHQSRPVRTTIDLGTQRAANAAAGAAPGSAGIVAVQASTGRVLAVADHQAGGLPRVFPLAGRYPPGTAFTIVSTEALLASHLAVDTRLRCPSKSLTGGQTFQNIPPVQGLGGLPPFSADFAHACGTVFAGLSRLMNAQKLEAAARGFGIGGQWKLPLPTFSGSLPPAGTLADLAAHTIGQGGVQVSPLGMALVAAQVDAGSWHAPSLTSGTGATQTQADSRTVFPASTMHSLQTLMRAAVRSGAARNPALAGQQVYGQVGTAQVKKQLWANWFVGYRGDVAFAVMVLSRSPATSAVPAGAQFLSALP